MSRKKIIISAIVAAAVVMASGGGVYAYNYHQGQIEQQKLEEQKKIEEKERLEREEQKRLEEAREAIQKELDDLEKQVTVLYSDDQKKMLAEGIVQDSIDAASAKLETLKEKYKENSDISLEQTEQIKNIEVDLQYIRKMYEILNAYNVFYSNGQLIVPGAEVKEEIENLKELLKELQNEKPDFCKTYEEKVSETENQILFQESVIGAVNMIYNRETGTMIVGVTRQQYTDVLVAVESLPENTLKAELKQYLTVVDQTLTVQEAAKAQIEKRSNSSGSVVSGNSSNAGTSSDGSSNNGNKSRSSKGSSGGSSNGGSFDSGSKGSSEGESASSGNVSSSGNSSSGNSSGGSGSSGGSSPSGSGGNSSEDDGYGSWDITITGGGDIKGGGTWESFEW